jgi:membrane protease YdiL (CAAX protease family)
MADVTLEDPTADARAAAGGPEPVDALVDASGAPAADAVHRGPRVTHALAAPRLALPAPDAGWSPSAPDRRTLRNEMWLVLWLSIASSALGAVLSLVESLTRGVPLSQQSRTLVGTYIADRPWLDILYQVAHISLALVPVLLVVHLLRRSGEGRQAIGIDMRDWPRDLLRGAVMAAVIGGAGLALYLVAFHLGFNVRLAAVTAQEHWWTPLLLVASAGYNAALEEVIVLGYFIHRMAQLGRRPWQQVGSSALLRATYHLYQGFGGFLGNLAMGTIFAVLFRRWGRVMPFLWAHLFIDATAFLGYYYLGGHVSWLP